MGGYRVGGSDTREHDASCGLEPAKGQLSNFVFCAASSASVITP